MDIASCISPALTLTIQIARLGLKMAEAPEEIRVVCDMTGRVYRAFKEYLRLNQTKAVKDYWLRVPEQKKFVDESIKDTLNTLRDIGGCMEAARMDTVEYGRVKTLNKFNWATMKKEVVLTYQRKLAMDHTDLMHHIEKLHRVEAEATPASKVSSMHHSEIAYSGTGPMIELDVTIIPPWRRREMRMRTQKAENYRLETRTDSAECSSEQKVGGDTFGLLVSLVHDVDKDEFLGLELQRMLSDPLPLNESAPDEASQLGMSLASASSSALTLIDTKETTGESLETSPLSNNLFSGRSTLIERRRKAKWFLTAE